MAAEKADKVEVATEVTLDLGGFDKYSSPVQWLFPLGLGGFRVTLVGPTLELSKGL